jgi:trimeric autotransporter adhesin
MLRRMAVFARFGVFVFASIFVVLSRSDAQQTSLMLSGTIDVANLRSNVGVTTSNDGEYLYATAYSSASINVLRRNQETGEASLVQTIVDLENLRGITDLKISPNGRFAIASAFTSKTAVLYQRDPSTGKLERTSVATNDKNGVTGLDWAIRGTFSPDGKFVYVANCGLNTAREFNNGSITSFRVTDDNQLEFLEVYRGKDNCFANARGLVMLCDGKTILATSSNSASLIVLDRDSVSGKLAIRQTIRDEEQGVHGLGGVMFVATSPDEKFVYTSSGRFKGDHTVGVYAFDQDSKLKVVQELVNGENGLKEFRGGNQLAVSPDGRNVYAVGTISGTLVVFDRDAKTGMLQFVTSLSAEKGWVNSVAGLCVSPDNRYVYVTGGERVPRVSIFKQTNVGTSN